MRPRLRVTVAAAVVGSGGGCGGGERRQRQSGAEPLHGGRSLVGLLVVVLLVLVLVMMVAMVLVGAAAMVEPRHLILVFLLGLAMDRLLSGRDSGIVTRVRIWLRDREHHGCHVSATLDKDSVKTATAYRTHPYTQHLPAFLPYTIRLCLP
uniref:Uncharacterized protein n=1 Tax=Oryza glumipatula TaxID=40148 RepID=A0A0D9ZVB6_9ORYZ